MKRLFGCHLSSSGGLATVCERANALRLKTAQCHATPPQRWLTQELPAAQIQAYNKAKESCTLEKLFFHAIYLINLANPDARMQNLSKTALTLNLKLAGAVGAAGVIFHLGSFKDEPDEAAGFARMSAALNEVLANSPANSTLLLEVSAGSGKVVGSKFEQLQTVYDKLEQKDRVGFALDTQHMWASGYDLVGEKEAVIKNLGDAFTYEKIKVIHLNDSATDLASKKDRHANLGDGKIGWAGLSHFINHPKLAHIPVILETPDLGEEGGPEREITKLSKMVAEAQA